MKEKASTNKTPAAESTAAPPTEEVGGLNLSLHFDPAVLEIFPDELAAELNVLPVCKAKGFLALVSKETLSTDQKKKIQSRVGLPVQTVPLDLVDSAELTRSAVRHSELLEGKLRRLASRGHFIGDSLKGLGGQTQKAAPLRKVLLELGLASEKEAPPAASDADVDLIDASLFVEEAILRLVPAGLARRHKALPLARRDSHLLIAAAAPLSSAAMLEIKLSAGAVPKLLTVREKDLDFAVERCYRRVNQIGFQQMRLGEILLARGVISRQQLDQALKKQNETSEKLGEILVKEGFASEEMIYSALAEKLGCEYQAFNYVEVDPEVSRVISKRFAESHMVLPSKLDRASDELVVAMANPQDLAVVDLLKTLCKQRGYELKIVISTPSNIEQGIAYTYHADLTAGTKEVEMETVVSERDDRSDLVLNSEMPKIKKIVNGLLYQAVMDGASDIHIENLESRVRVRFRIDGILQLRSTAITKENIGQVISVLKIDSGLDITERRRPQDGVFKKRIGKDWYIDFRINVHCTQFGADAVIRILDSTKKLPKLNELGLSEEVLTRFLKLVNNPQGLILITGPTGSGKSTTLYSTLSHLNLAEKKIVTAEDPIEYHLDGICQYQVNDQIGNTFAEYGRRFLRKDPDVILIGETRDETTAESCVRAAMTGHLVFSTLHTNHAAAAIARLRDLGVDSSSICDALLAVVAQRLVRRNCERCAEEYSPDAETLEEFYLKKLPKDLNFVRGVGCPACSHTGYRGRVGVYEFWELNRETRYAILSGASEEEVLDLARRSGLKPLIVDALSKVHQGITTLEELRRVLPLEQIRTFAATAGEIEPSGKVTAFNKS